MTEGEILYQIGNFWVRAEKFGTGKFKPKSDGYSIWECGITHSEQVATIGYSGADGLRRAIAEAKRRHAVDIT